MKDMQITTSLAAYCAYDDWCGVCEGNGQSCCTDALVKQYCKTDDLCNVPSCGVVVSILMINSCLYYYYYYYFLCLFYVVYL